MATDETSQLFGARLKQIINESTFTQKEIANELGISENALTNYIQGRRSPNVLLVAQLAGMLNINLNWLLLGEGFMYFSAEKERQAIGGRSAEGKSELERELALLQEENRALKEKLLYLNSDNAVQNSKIDKMEKQIERIMSILDKPG